MKTSIRKTHEQIDGEFRDTLHRGYLWINAIFGVFVLAGLSFIAPLLYIWIIGLTAATAAVVVSMVGAASMFRDGPFGFIFGAEMIKGGFQIAGYILLALVGVSSND